MSGPGEPLAPSTIRPVVPGDFDRWAGLWRGYLRFYREELPDEVTKETFDRLCRGTHEMFGFVAERDGELVGIAHGLLHPSTWSPSPSCYLEDLFVARSARGTGTGRQLIEAVAGEATRRGAVKLYWHTQEFNGAARSLYDVLATRVSFVVYERQLAPPGEGGVPGAG